MAEHQAIEVPGQPFCLQECRLGPWRHWSFAPIRECLDTVGTVANSEDPWILGTQMVINEQRIIAPIGEPSKALQHFRCLDARRPNPDLRWNERSVLGRDTVRIDG